MSTVVDLLGDRLLREKTIDRLLVLLGPEAAAPLERHSALAYLWREFYVAKIAAKGEVIESGGGKHSFEVEQAITARDELDAVLLLTPSRSTASAMVRLLYASLICIDDALGIGEAVDEDRASVLPWWQHVMLEAMHDLLADGWIPRIAKALDAEGANPS